MLQSTTALLQSVTALLQGVTAFKLVRENTATMYPAVSDVDVLNVHIPILSNQLQNKIEQIIKLALNKSDQSCLLYHQAESLLLQEIGLQDFVPSSEKCNIKSFKESFLSTGRLDAEYYQKKYEEIEQQVKKYKNGFMPVSEQFVQNENLLDYSRQQYNYIEIGDISVGNGSYSYNTIDISNLPANAKIKSEKNDVLVSKVRPYRGAVSIINQDVQDLVVSGAFTVLREKTTYKKETLFVLLRTSTYRDWLLRWNVGTSYPVIKDDDVLNLPIPLVDAKIQQQIAALIAESFRLWEESERLLETCKGGGCN